MFSSPKHSHTLTQPLIIHAHSPLTQHHFSLCLTHPHTLTYTTTTPFTPSHTHPHTYKHTTSQPMVIAPSVPPQADLLNPSVVAAMNDKCMVRTYLRYTHFLMMLRKSSFSTSFNVTYLFLFFILYLLASFIFSYFFILFLYPSLPSTHPFTHSTDYFTTGTIRYS